MANSILGNSQRPEARGQRPANARLLLDRGRGADKTAAAARSGEWEEMNARLPFFTGTQTVDVFTEGPTNNLF